MWEILMILYIYLNPLYELWLFENLLAQSNTSRFPTLPENFFSWIFPEAFTEWKQKDFFKNT
jgi:hypothetical protein